MKAVFRHELSSYFTGMTGYVFGAFVLVFAGIYCMVYNLKSQVVNFEYVMGSMSFIFLIVVPILTMRVISEEKRQKTDQLLYSLPVTMTKVVLGKYAALLVTMLIPMLILSVYPLILHHFGNVYLPASYAAIVGFFFLGAALISIGMFVSSLTESQAVAAGICFIVMLLNYFIASLSGYVSTGAFSSLIAFTVVILLFALILWRMTRSGFTAATVGLVLEAVTILIYTLKSSLFEGLFPKVIDQLSLFERFYSIVDGVLDLTTLVYYISISAVFLFLTVQSLEKRRWSE